jgi:hypothetical protein
LKGGDNLATIKIITVEEAQEIMAKYPKRARGEWQKLLEQVKKTKKAVVISDISRGMAWNIARSAKQSGLVARVIEGGKAVVVSPSA